MRLLQRFAMGLAWLGSTAVARVSLVAADGSAIGSILTPPSPAILAIADAHHLPVRGIEAFEQKTELRPDDFVTVLFTLMQGEKRRQWLAEFRVVELTPQEKTKKATSTSTIHTSTGLTFEFNSRSAALNLRIFGPCALDQAATETAGEKAARILVKTDFLGAGFDRECEISLHMVETKTGFPYHLSTAPFSAERIAKDKAAATKSGLRFEDERAIAAVGPALDEFFGIAEHTPGLKELVFIIADLPPPWAWITGGNTGFFFDPAGMARLDGADWDLAGTTLYRAPFNYTLKGTSVMKGVFYFAPPRSPLLTCAGVVALIVQSPKHPEKKLELRVLAARRGVAPATSQ